MLPTLVIKLDVKPWAVSGEIIICYDLSLNTYEHGSHLDSLLDYNNWEIKSMAVLQCYINKWYSVQLSGPGLSVVSRGSAACSQMRNSVLHSYTMGQ